VKYIYIIFFSLGLIFFGGLIAEAKKNKKKFKYKFPEKNLNPFQPPVLFDFSANLLGFSLSSELQKVKLSKIKLVGVWSQKEGEEKCLLVMDRNGSDVGAVAKVGDRIGSEGGKIRLINKDRIIVRVPAYYSSNIKKFKDKSILIEKNLTTKKSKNDVIIYK